MIYLDYNATTPIDKEVAEAMLPYIYGSYGNPSSTHALGLQAKNAVEKARTQVAAFIHCSADEVIFTSGGSESNNAVIKGVAFPYRNKRKRIVTSVIEHPAVLKPCRYLEESGFEVKYVSVDEYGIVDMRALEKAIDDETILVTIMHANNETGTLQPVKEIAEICHRRGVLFHTDASQSLGKVPVDVKDLGVDFLAIAGHKLYAPKGIGALYIKKGIEIEPLIHGAGHESGRRAGTENIIFDVALGKACELAQKALEKDGIKALAEYFWRRLREDSGERIKLNGHPEKRLPNTLNVSFLGYDGHDLLSRLEDVAASTGSACHSGLTTISPVLKAMGVTEEAGRDAVRFSLGRYTTKQEIDTVLEKLKKIMAD